MSQLLDFKMDGEDHDLVFKSSDGKLFSVSKIRAMESKVWKDMLEVGKNHQEQGVTTLSEDSKLLLKLFKAMNARDLLVDLPEELQNLKAVDFVDLVEAAAKYDVEIVLVFVYLELNKMLCPGNVGQLSGWNGFKAGGWDVTQIMKLFVLSQPLTYPRLTNVAAKFTMLVEGIIADQSEESSKLLLFREHIMPLYAFKRRWDKIRSSICQQTGINNNTRFTLVYRSYDFFGTHSAEPDPKVAVNKLCEALLNLEYQGLEELEEGKEKAKKSTP